MKAKTTKVGILEGMNLRNSYLLCEKSRKFECDVKIRKIDQDIDIDGKSIFEVCLLAAIYGTELEIKTEGKDEEKAINKITQFIEGN